MLIINRHCCFWKNEGLNPSVILTLNYLKEFKFLWYSSVCFVKTRIWVGVETTLQSSGGGVIYCDTGILVCSEEYVVFFSFCIVSPVKNSDQKTRLFSPPFFQPHFGTWRWSLMLRENLLGMPETSLRGRRTLTALSVLRSKSAPTVARILHTQVQHRFKLTAVHFHAFNSSSQSASAKTITARNHSGNVGVFFRNTKQLLQVCLFFVN